MLQYGFKWNIVQAIPTAGYWNLLEMYEAKTTGD
jgi:hypothetical protein